MSLRAHLAVVPALLAVLLPAGPVGGQEDGAVPACYATGGGSLEICRSGSEPEGVLFAPPTCQFAQGVQILRLKGRAAPGPLQVVYHGEPRREARGEDCPEDLRATDPQAGGSVRTGRQVEALALAMPPTDYRFWTAQATRPSARRTRRGRDRARVRSRRRGQAQAQAQAQAQERAAFVAAAEEGSAGRNPMVVAGRDWAGDDYHHLFMVASEVIEGGRRHVLIQGRTYDFEAIDVKARLDDAVGWVPFGANQSRRGRRGDAPVLVPVTDEAGKPIVANCAAEGFEPRGLIGAISVVDQVYHYFYTDVLPSDCGEPRAKRRMGLYLRTSRDVAGEKAWSAARTVIAELPPDTLVRVAKAKGMDRWAVAYSCFRPSNAPGGPVADICLHYTPDLAVGSIAGLGLFSEPASAMRSTAFLGLRSGGDGGGRYGRENFYWMTDRYGNLDTPAIYPTKGGLLTWVDRLAPRTGGRDGSTVYGRPVFWSTWSVRPREAVR